MPRPRVSWGRVREIGPELPVVLDVRTEGEFNGRGGHIAGAILVPVDVLPEVLDQLTTLRYRPRLPRARHAS